MPKLTDKRQQTEVSEIFSSLQGEGPYLGVRQIFVRFGRCNMHCGYCDELEKMKAENFTVLTLTELMRQVARWEREKGPHHSVSLTGGEPLFYTAFLENLLPRLKQKGYGTYLESNGTLPRELDRVIRHCDIVAMDMKPVTSTGDRAFFEEHTDFLKVAARKDVFVKVVVTPGTTLEEIDRCARIVESVDPHIPFIFQPQSDAFGINSAALALIEKSFTQTVERRLFDVRVIPQLHKIWGVR